MNYQKHYDQLIERARHRILPEEVYSEKHHVIPKCLGGNDYKCNLVRLLPEEHITAHRLLCRIHPGNSKLAFAVICIAQYRHGRKARQLYSADRKLLSTTLKGKPGRKCSEEQKRIVSEKLKGRKRTPEAIAAISKGQIGKKRTNIEAMRLHQKGRIRIHDGSKGKMIPPEDFPIWEARGFIKGHLKKPSNRHKHLL